MTPQLKRALNKLYNYQNGEYDHDRRVYIYIVQTLSDKEQALLADSGWQANDIVAFADHDDVLRKLATLQGHQALTQARCMDAFVAGVGGSWLRGRSVLAAWHKLNSLPMHTYHEDRTRFACCWVCQGQAAPDYENDGYLQYCLYVGNAYASTPKYAYLCLRHLAEVAPVRAADTDVAAFRALMELLRNAPEGETPGQFEKRLNAAKIIPGDKYTKRGLLDALASVGVIPNRFVTLSPHTWTAFGDIAVCEKQLNNTKGRSDMEMPWAGWQGMLKANEEILHELFGDYL